jgi:RNA polymerase sigma factor (sigma-70 family)
MSKLAKGLEIRAQPSESRQAITTLSDANLIQHCQKGENGAWAELVHRYALLVFSVPRHAGLTEADSEDVMQEVFRILFLKLGTLRDPSRLRAWLITCAHNQTIEHLRHSHPTAVLDDELIPSNGNLQRIEQVDMLRKAVGGLTGNEKIIVSALFENPDISDSELAVKTGLKADSVRMVKSRGLCKLKRALGEMGWKR